MAKSKNINLNLTPENEIEETLFDDWRQSIDGYNGENAVNPSNFEIVDKEIGDIKEALKHVSTLHFEVVEELPDIGQPNIIYLVPSEESKEKNFYDEYIYIEESEKFELIGSTQITFDNTPTKDSPNAVTSGGVYNALLDKQDVIQDLDTIRSGAQKGETAVQPGDLATVATTGSYNDLINKPDIPEAQIQSDWDQTNSAAPDFIKNKPEVPEVNNPTIIFIQDGNQKGQITLNQTNDQTIEFEGGEAADVDAIYEDLNLPKVPDPTRTPTYKQIKQLETENQVNSDLINIITDDLGLTELGEEEYPSENERTSTKQNLLTLKRLVNILLDELGLDKYENKDYPITEDYIPIKDKLSIANPVVEGTESTLNSLQIGDTKYIIPQSGGINNKVNITFETVPGGELTINLDRTNDEIIEMLKNGVVNINGNYPNTGANETAIFNALILTGNKIMVNNAVQYQFLLLNADSNFILEYDFSGQKWYVSMSL